MNKELIISETEQFINDEIFYIQIEYGEKETANERFYLNTAKRLTKAYSLYKKNNIFKNDYILALRDFLTINEQIQNIAQKKDTLCRRMYN